MTGLGVVTAVLALVAAIWSPSLPAGAATPAPGIGCAEGQVDASWTVSYVEGRYRLDTADLGVVDGCAGATLLVLISARNSVEVITQVTVPDGPISVDVREHDIPAAFVDRIALFVDADVATPPATGEPGAGMPVPTSGAGLETTDHADVDPAETDPADDVAGMPSNDQRHDGLSLTGTWVPWLIPVAIGLMLLGSWSRRRRHDAPLREGGPR